MNVLVLGARIVGTALAYELVDAFIKAKFISNEERFTRRFKKVLAIEAKYQRGGKLTPVILQRQSRSYPSTQPQMQWSSSRLQRKV